MATFPYRRLIRRAPGRGMESRDDVVAMSGFAGFFRRFASHHIRYILACTFA